jgi:hypothetical protein
MCAPLPPLPGRQSKPPEAPSLLSRRAKAAARGSTTASG